MRQVIFVLLFIQHERRRKKQKEWNLPRSIKRSRGWIRSSKNKRKGKKTWIFVCLNFRYRMISCEFVKRQRNWNKQFFFLSLCLLYCHCRAMNIEQSIMMRVDAPHLLPFTVKESLSMLPSSSSFFYLFFSIFSFSTNDSSKTNFKATIFAWFGALLV